LAGEKQRVKKIVILSKSIIMKVYDEIIDFLAAGTTPQTLVSFKASPETQQRVRDLLKAQKEETATQSQLEELDDYLRLEHIMRLTKARARRYAQS
jgi:hypothetical protein